MGQKHLYVNKRIWRSILNPIYLRKVSPQKPNQKRFLGVQPVFSLLEDDRMGIIDDVGGLPLPTDGAYSCLQSAPAPSVGRAIAARMTLVRRRGSRPDLRLAMVSLPT